MGGTRAALTAGARHAARGTEDPARSKPAFE
jgi:hypothetical protein